MSGIPILRDLTPVGRIAVIVTLAISILAIVMEWVLHITGTPMFFVSALGILGLAYVVGISTERLGALAGPQVGGILDRGDALVFRDETREDVEQRCFSGTGAAGNDDV